MMDAKALLDRLTGGQGLEGLAGKAKEAWDGQSPLGKGVIAGGLLGVLLTRGGRRLVGTGAKVGGAALIGGLAWRAYEDWKAGRVPGGAEAPDALEAPHGSAFRPADEATSQALAQKLVQAMVAAAKADGDVTPDERGRIDAALSRLGLGDGAQDLIMAELDAPVDVRRIAALAGSEAEAAEIYAATLLVINQKSLEEKGYLAMLAAALNLDPALVAHLDAKTATLG